MSADKKNKKPPFKKWETQENPDNNIIPLVLADTELEKVVLGTVLLQSNALENLGGNFSENLFYLDIHKIIAKAILELFLKNKPIDILTVTNQLRETPFPALVDGTNWAYYISTLTNRVASPDNIEFHIRILQQYYLGRHINDVCNHAKYQIFNPGNDIFDVYDQLQIKLENALKNLAKYEISTVREIHMGLIRTGLQIAEHGGIPGVPSGISDIDEYTNGWQPSDFIIVAGRPGMGKTAFAVSMLTNATVKYKVPIAMFSLEMSKEQLVGRIQSSFSGIDASRIIKKQVTKEEIEIIDNSCIGLYSAPMFIDDTPNISLVELKTKARKLVREDGIKMIIIDYLQLMRSGLNINNREQEIAEISKGLKAIAKELAIPVIALSQLSRKVEERSDKKPLLSDLRESGQIEQDADMVIFAYRPEYYGKDIYEISTNTISATNLFVGIIAKHRNGGLGEIMMTFVPEQALVAKYGYTFNKESTTFVENNIKVLQNNTNFDNEGSVPYLTQGANSNNDPLPF